MDFPHRHDHGHGHGHHHRRDDDEEQERYRPPPPPPPEAYIGGDDSNYGRPSYPHHSSGVEHVSHEGYGGGSDYNYGRPSYPNQSSGIEHVSHEGYGGGGDYNYGRPRPSYPHQSSGVEHVSHEGYGGGGDYSYGRPSYPPNSSAVEHVTQEAYGGGGDYAYGRPRPSYPPNTSAVEHVAHEGYGGGGEPERQPTVRIFCKANEDYSVTIRDGVVVLAPTDRDDEYQHWIKDMKYSTKVKDEEGYPAFALVNKVTEEALKHSLGQSHPVRLTPYDPHRLDESILWTESRDVGAGFRCIRMVNNIYLNFDAFHGDKDHGGVRDGTTLVLWEWCEGDNQRWKIAPY
ncbi:uncharacterized protein [Typha latifolia]|uniref:uncharacterized protein n=1 Tax=Typha latifolia TaxID=4733 RepID=UPI003C2CAC2D